MGADTSPCIARTAAAMNARNKLMARRRSLIRQLSAQSTQADSFDLHEELKQLENYDKLIKYMSPTYGPVLLACAVALICITVVGVAWTSPVSSNRLIVDVEADAIEMRLAGSWEWRQLPAKLTAMRMEQMTSIEVPSQGVDRSPPILLNGRPWVDLQNGRISIDGINFETAAQVRIHRAEDGYIYVHTLGAPMSGHLSILGESLDIEAGRERNAPELSYTIKRNVPESLVFASAGAGMIPAILRMQPDQSMVLTGISVDRLSFARQVSGKPGHSEFACTISSGTLRFSDTEQVTSLEKGDCLSMRGEFGRLVDLKIDETIQIKFEGTAKQIEIGPEGFQRDVTPTYLEWLYHNQRLSFLWGAVVFVWGMLWSIRKVLVT